MKIKHLLFTLLLALMVPLAANAQTGSAIYSENFDSYTVGSNTVTPTGWTVTTSGSGVAGTVFNGNPYSLPNSFLMGNVNALTANRIVMAQLPTFTMPVNCTKLTFRVRSSSASMGENTLSVGYGYSSSLSGNQTVVLHTCEASTGYQLVTVPFNLSVVPDDAFIFFLYEGKNGAPAQTYWYIDNVFVYNDLQAPTDFAVTDVSFTTATLSWTLNGNGSAQMRYSTNSDFSDSHNSTTGNLTGLEMGTTYYAQVRSRVRLNSNSLWSYSDWSETLTFTTDALVAVPYPGAYHEIFAPSLSPGEIDLPDNHWAGLVSPTGQGAIQMFNELVNPNLPNGLREGWMRLKCTGTPGFNNPIRLTTALPNFDCPVNLLKVKLLIKPSSTTNSSCGYLSLGYVIGNDLTNFTTIESYNPADYSASEYTTIEKVISGKPANARLALRYSATQSGQSGSYWDIDYNMVTGDLVSEIVPTNLQLASHTDNTATFTWDAITGATYELQSRTFDKATNEWSDWTVVDAVSTNSYTIETPSRRYRYYVRVRAVGYDDQNNPYYGSTYTDEAGYFPGEEMLTEFPFSFSFWNFTSNPEVNNLYQDGESHNWYYYNASTSTNTIHTKYGDAIYRFLPNNNLQNVVFCVAEEGNEDYQPQPQYLISPKIQDLSTKQMRFEGEGFRLDGEEKIDLTVEVGVMTDPIDPSTFQLIRTVTLNGNYVYPLAYDICYFYAFEGQDAHVAIKVPVTDKRSFLRIDYVNINVAPVCKPMRHLAVVENSLTDHSVGLTWERQDESQWEIQYKRLPIVGEEDWQSVIVDEYPYTLTGLMSNNSYKIRVRAYCGTDEQGDWSNEIEIRTDCGEFENLPYYEDFENTGPVTWAGNVATSGYGYNPMPQCYYTDNEKTAYVRTDRRIYGSEVWSEHSLELYPIAYTVPNAISRVYLPKMNNLKHLRIRFSAKVGNYQQANVTTGTFLNVYVCDHYTTDLSECVVIANGIFGIETHDPSSFELTRDYQEFTLYTTSQDQFDEGYIMFYSNNPCYGANNCDGKAIVDIDWIEVTVFDYDKHFTGMVNSNWNYASNWDPVGVPTSENNVYLNDNKNVIIPSGCAAEVNAINFDSDKTTLTIKDGGSLKFNMGQSHQSGAQNLRVLNVTMEKNIQAYTPGSKDHYYLLAVPASNYNGHIIDYGDFSFNFNINTPEYLNTDLYSFDPSNQGAEWRNWKTGHITPQLYRSEAVLYANAAGKQFSWSIKVDVPEDFEKTVQQPLQQGAPLYRWTLLGNPYICEAYIRDSGIQNYYFPYYIMNANGDALVLAPSGRGIKPLEGVFVQGWETGVTHYAFTPDAPLNRGGNIDLTVRNASTRSADVLDRARVEFSEGTDFEHCDIMPSPNRLYIPSDSKQLSVAHAGTLGEMPVNFEPATDGTYTIGMETEKTDLSYLHLIDNLTGADINLLQQPEYTFNARYSDYPSRFKLVFAKGSSEHDNDFAFIRNGHLMLFGIEGNATLQVIDMLGHVLTSEQFSGSYDKQIQAAPGVYVIRLINGENVKTQKIVVK